MAFKSTLTHYELEESMQVDGEHRKKKYVTRACDSCKRRKSKCDGTKVVLPSYRGLKIPSLTQYTSLAVGAILRDSVCQIPSHFF